MITSQAANYAKVLYSLGIDEESVRRAEQILTEHRELVNALENPVINKQEKEAVVKDIFSNDILGFINVLCNNRCIGIFDKIFKAYETIILDSKNLITAKLSYVTRPDDEEISQIKDMVCSKYKKAGVILTLEEDTSLIGGFVLTVGDTEYDKSIKGTLSELQKALVRR